MKTKINDKYISGKSKKGKRKEKVTKKYFIKKWNEDKHFFAFLKELQRINKHLLRDLEYYTEFISHTRPDVALNIMQQLDIAVKKDPKQTSIYFNDLLSTLKERKIRKLNSKIRIVEEEKIKYLDETKRLEDCFNLYKDQKKKRDKKIGMYTHIHKEIFSTHIENPHLHQIEVIRLVVDRHIAAEDDDYLNDMYLNCEKDSGKVIKKIKDGFQKYKKRNPFNI